MSRAVMVCVVLVDKRTNQVNLSLARKIELGPLRTTGRALIAFGDIVDWLQDHYSFNPDQPFGPTIEYAPCLKAIWRADDLVIAEIGNGSMPPFGEASEFYEVGPEAAFLFFNVAGMADTSC